MKVLSLLTSLVLLAVSGSAVAHPALVKRADPTQTQILQYALTLEHLENAFYHGGLAKFGAQAFEKAGFPSYVRGRIAQIGQHEQSHVDFLSKALGSSAVAACQYSLFVYVYFHSSLQITNSTICSPYTDPESFIALSNILENVGTTAYLGGAKFITDPGVLTAAGSILATEARHAAWINAVPQKGAPFSGSFQTPLDQNQVFTLAASFITSCPASNQALPFTAFPALAVKGTAAPGKKVKLTYTDSGSGARFLAIFSGLTTVFAPIDANKEVTIPNGLQGLVFGVVSSDGTAVTDANTIAGVAIINIPIPSYASNP